MAVADNGDKPVSATSIPFDEVNAHTERAREFLALNFTETEAHLLAAADAEVSAVKRLLDRGCTHRLATLILV